ncbi:5212_t:CDS:2 [Acaulospora morrowiae]|uniref:5212_t:CDS:1 n=1 Tax=Acaulospora morrowiae TaxID=94023 RepID=A0A9N9IC78_9GLOM|nr:5212_t:CDS:2 [Acaulospora morrowiae]
MSDKVARIIMNLLTTEPAYINVMPPPYDTWKTYEEKVVKTLSCLRRDGIAKLSYPALSSGKLADLLSIPEMGNRADLSD